MTLDEIPTETLRAELQRRQATGSDTGIQVRDAVASAFDVSAFALYGRERTARISEARFACYVLLRRRGYSLNEVAAITGRKDHGSALHGLRRAGDLIDRDPEFRNRLAIAFTSILNAELSGGDRKHGTDTSKA
jgi:chromosomal replication initiation ATPase DnaA